MHLLAWTVFAETLSNQFSVTVCLLKKTQRHNLMQLSQTKLSTVT